MKRRVIGLFVAVVMALVGTVLVASFVRSAEARALAGEELVDVLVVTDDVPAGATVDEVRSRVAVERVPAKVRAVDALSDLDPVGGLVTEIALRPGEQLSASRFVAPDLLTRASVAVPAGMVEVTVSLSPERAVGGALLPGDIVTLFASFDPFEIGAPSSATAGVPDTVIIDGIRLAGDSKTPSSSRLLETSILVTNVQIEELLPEVDPEESSGGRFRAPAPTGNLLITMAVSPTQAERLVFTAEHGMIWLAAQPSDVDLTDTRVQNRFRIYGTDQATAVTP